MLKCVTGVAGEQAIFRVDHALGLANRIMDMEPLWNGTHIEQIDILWDETLALEGRASYYDTAGALKDVIQNHLLQILCLLAMEPPVTLGERDLRDRKLDVKVELDQWAPIVETEAASGALWGMVVGMLFLMPLAGLFVALLLLLFVLGQPRPLVAVSRRCVPSLASCTMSRPGSSPRFWSGPSRASRPACSCTCWACSPR